MRKLKSIFLLMLMAIVPLQSFAAEEESKELDIPEIVLEHLADAYEWHIASYQGKHLSIPLPIIVRSENTGEWHFCTAHSLPESFYFDQEHHGKIYEKMPDGTAVRPLDLSITKSCGVPLLCPVVQETRREERGTRWLCGIYGDVCHDDSRRPHKVVYWREAL